VFETRRRQAGRSAEPESPRLSGWNPGSIRTGRINPGIHLLAAHERWRAGSTDGQKEVLMAGERSERAAGEAEIPPPPWQRLPDRQGRRRRAPISRDAIVDAAVRLLDSEGLAALSMRRLAEELGTGAASLYWHVGSKDGLLDLVLDQIIGEQKVPAPDPAQWREQIKEVARTQRRTSLRHPYVVRISIGRIPMGPNALRYSEAVLAILRAGGLSPRLAVQGYLLLIATVNGFTVDETGMDDGDAGEQEGAYEPGDQASMQQAADMARDYIASLPAGLFPNMTSLAGEFALADPDERFELLIDIFVDGLARRT
jgi:AcrR family transcriptional regulator